MPNKTNINSPIDIARLAAYAEDPRSYCHYKGKPRSLHNKNSSRENIPRGNPISSSMSRGLLIVSILCLSLSGWCLWILLG